PALLLQGTRARCFAVPLAGLTPSVRDAELHDHVRIRPVDLRDLAAELHRRVGVKFRVEGVVGPRGASDRQNRKNSNSSKSLHIRTPVEGYFVHTTGFGPSGFLGKAVKSNLNGTEAPSWKFQLVLLRPSFRRRSVSGFSRNPSGLLASARWRVCGSVLAVT